MIKSKLIIIQFICVLYILTTTTGCTTNIIKNKFIDYCFGVYNESRNSVKKSIGLLGFYGTNPLQIMRVAVTGEDKLSKAGIEAGKKYIRKKK